MYKITIMALMLAGCAPPNPYETKMTIEGFGSMEDVYASTYSYQNQGYSQSVVVICNDGNRFFFDR